jgi:amino acid transporter
MKYPLVVSVLSLALLLIAARVGDVLRKRAGGPDEDERADLGPLLGAVLTLLFFITGFAFMMAIGRYDLRKACEQAEAVAIRTEYARADLLAPADAAKVQTLLKEYLDQRLLFYTTRGSARASEITASTVRLQTDLWSTIRPALAAVPPPLMGVVVTGMDDLTNSQRVTQATWLNRVPLAAWVLMTVIGVGCCWLIAYRARRTDWLAFMIVPIAVAVCFFLIADLDSPRGGAIRVAPVNLESLAHSLPAQ